MWFDVLKLDLSDLQQNLKNVDADADAINIQKPNKCKEKLLKIIEIMKDADRKAREALPNVLEEASKESEYKNKDGETITFKVGDWRDEKRVFAENAPYRFGFSVRSDMRDSDKFKEMDEMVACQLLEALKVVLVGLDEPVSKRKRVKNSEGQEIGRVEYEFLTGRDSYIRNKLAIYDTSQSFDFVSIACGGNGFPYSHETFEGYEDFERELIIELSGRVYEPAFKKIRGML